MVKRYVYSFEEGRPIGKELLGGKGLGLAEMVALGLPVPPGFTITTEACREYFSNGEKYPDGLFDQVEAQLRGLEAKTEKKLGDPKNPLLVSVRAGAEISMPGMMDTILSVGLNDESVQGLIHRTRDEIFAWKSYLKYLRQWGGLIMGISSYEMPPLNYQGNASSLEQAVENYKRVIRSSKGEDFPQDPKEQIRMAIKTVFNSWNSKRAKEYRKISEIDDSLGTAANIQTMVFGNIGYTSGTGVLFTRDTKTGRNVIYGEFLRNAQGPDLVSGNVTPIGRFKEELEKIRPGLYDELKTLTKNLEQNRKNVQDIEFTVEEGVLWMLQRRDARVSAKAAVRIAVDLANEGLIDKETAVRRVHPNQLKGIYSYVIDPKAKKQARAIARGLAASPISSTGQAVFTIDDAVNWQADGKKVILVRVETTPDDIEGITASEGILTSTGGLTCHAALVSNSMGKSCIVGCKELDVDEEKSRAKTGKHLIKKGDYVTLDGSTGDVYKRQLPFVKPKLSRHAKTFLKWIDEMKG